MTHASRRQFLSTGLAGAALMAGGRACAQDESGPDWLKRGPGSFEVTGGPGREDLAIGVRYFMPRHFSPRSPILLVIPGSGRNAGDYRDAWIPIAQRAGVLVAALNYPRRDYDFAAYQMGGVIEDIEVDNAPRPGRDGLPRRRARVLDEDVRFDLNWRRDAWLFADFDRVFDMLVRATGSRRTRYDLFGHSAGAQIAHRTVLFRPESKLDRVISANAGLYTLPALDQPLLTGLQGTGATRASLAASFRTRLTVMLGEEDVKPGDGTLRLSTPRIDQQGRSRFDRGQYFYEVARDTAREIGAPFNWRLRIIPGVGHDHEGMTRAAGRYLYG